MFVEWRPIRGAGEERDLMPVGREAGDSFRLDAQSQPPPTHLVLPSQTSSESLRTESVAQGVLGSCSSLGNMAEPPEGVGNAGWRQWGQPGFSEADGSPGHLDHPHPPSKFQENRGFALLIVSTEQGLSHRRHSVNTV